LRKAVQRSRETQETFQHRGEKECAAAGKLFLVDIEVDAQTTGKANALL
jgi:hypothetical protein